MDALLAAYKQFLSELLAVDPYPFDNDLDHKLPKTPGIYRIFKRGCEWQDSIYVGAADNLRKQIFVYHYAGNLRESTLKRTLLRYGVFPDEKAIQMFLGAECNVQFKEVLDERERVWLKHFAIAVLKPLYNDVDILAKLNSVFGNSSVR